MAGAPLRCCADENDQDRRAATWQLFAEWKELHPDLADDMNPIIVNGLMPTKVSRRPKASPLLAWRAAAVHCSS